MAGVQSRFFAGSDSILAEIEQADGSVLLVAQATQGGITR